MESKQDEGRPAPAPIRKRDYKIRWLVLVLSSMFMMTSYYCLDNPAALHDAMKAHFSQKFDEKRFEKFFSLFYTVYHLPNVLLPFFGGALIDRFGYRWMNLVFGAFLMTGHTLFAAGIESKDIALALAGRVLYGFGGECIIVGLSALLDDWFGGTAEFAAVMGINLSLGRLGSVLNNVGSSMLYHDEGLPFAVWFGVILLAIAMGCGIIFAIIDISVERQISASVSEQGLDSKEHEINREDVSFFEFRFFTKPYWLLVLSCILLYGCIIPFNNVSGAMINERYICHGPCCPTGQTKCEAQKRAESKSSFVMGIPFVISAVLSPIMGGIVGKFGGNAVLIIASSFVLMMVHLTFSISTDFTVLVIFLVFMGLAYTTYAASLWPSVPATVEKHQVGTAYGLMTALQNIGLATFPLCVGAIRAEAGEYGSVEIFFTVLASLSLCLSFYIMYYDQNSGGLLNMSASERDVALPEFRAKLKAERLADSRSTSDIAEAAGESSSRILDKGHVDSATATGTEASGAVLVASSQQNGTDHDGDDDDDDDGSQPLVR